MRNYFIVFLFLLNLSILFKFSSGELYNDDQIDSVYPDGQGGYHYNINYFPTSTNLNYTGEKFKSLEFDPNIKKVTLIQDCMLQGISAKIDSCSYLGSSLSIIDNNSAGIVKGNVAIIVPPDVTLTIAGSPRTIPILIVRGRVLLHSNYNTTFSFFKMQILPNGIFQSTPSQQVNHTIIAQQPQDSLIYQWYQTDIPSILSISGNVTIKGFDSNSTWAGFIPYSKEIFLRSFPFTILTPVIKLSGLSNSFGIENYILEKYTNPLVEPIYPHIGHILINPFNKNVWIKGIGSCSIIFTGSSTVDIQNSVFNDFGHTTSLPFDQHINIPNRYPITLYHNKKSVNIENNCFLPPLYFDQQSFTPRSFIGAIRSFGNIIGNSFVLRENSTTGESMDMSGISLLYGTEQFNISFNSFISIYSNTTALSGREYPDGINYINSGIVSTSPYSSFEWNFFEGRFKGGSIHIIPLQSRSEIAGLNSDKLLGVYNGYEQSNSNDRVSNSIWNKVIFKDNLFFGESEFRVTYPMTNPSPIKINFLRGWHINQRPSMTLPPNEANVDYSYDSSLVWIRLRPEAGLETNTLSGKCNSVSIKNGNFSSSYKFFSDSFRCNYISIIDTQFTQKINVGNDSISFLKRFTNQLYLSNVNGTKNNYFLAMYCRLYPFYQLSPKSIINKSLAHNSINFTFIPSFEGAFNRPLILETIINDVLQNSTIVNPQEYSIYSKLVQLPKSANGLYTVVLSTRPTFPNSTQYANYAQGGSYFAGTYLVDNSANNFYIGIDLSPFDLTKPPRALSIFNKPWTKCNWVQSSNKCTTTGIFSSYLTMVANQTELPQNDEFLMITSYLGNDIVNNIPSTLNISLPGPHQYKFYLYSFNPEWTDSISNPIPSFSIKINDKYQEPITRPAPSYLAYEKYGPFYWNNLNSTEQTLSIKWANDIIQYSIPLSGIEIYSSIQISFPIPISI
ncbi:hypothetical protein ACTFIU_010514 [Dictyostelium citrinum]